MHTLESLSAQKQQILLTIATLSKEEDTAPKSLETLLMQWRELQSAYHLQGILFYSIHDFKKVASNQNEHRYMANLVERVAKRVLKKMPSSPTRSLSHTGIRNLGANCWANALMQLAIHIPELREHLIFNLPSSMSEITRFAIEYVADENARQSSTKASSQEVRNALSRVSGGSITTSPFQQCDAHEALQLMLHQIDPIPEGTSIEMLERGEEHFSNPLFHLQQVSRRYDIPASLAPTLATDAAELTPDGCSKKWEIGSQLSLGLTDLPHRNVQDVIEEHFCSKKALSGETARYHGHQLKLVEERLKLKTAPTCFIAHFKRFNADQSKIHCKIQFPNEIVMKGEYFEDRQANAYEVEGFIVHRGTFRGGHYIAYYRKNDQWYCCDDSRVSLVSHSVAKEAMQDMYLCFMRKKRSLSDEEASTLLREDASTRAPLERLRMAARSSSEQRAFDQAVLEKMQNRCTKDLFLQLLPDTQKKLAHMIWILHGCPEEEDYGRKAILRKPSILHAPAPGLLYGIGRTLPEQLQALYIQQFSSSRKNTLRLHIVGAAKAMQSTELSEKQKKAVINALPQDVKNYCARKIWEECGHPDIPNFGMNLLLGIPEILVDLSKSGHASSRPLFPDLVA